MRSIAQNEVIKKLEGDLEAKQRVEDEIERYHTHTPPDD